MGEKEVLCASSQEGQQQPAVPELGQDPASEPAMQGWEFLATTMYENLDSTIGGCDPRHSAGFLPKQEVNERHLCFGLGMNISDNMYAQDNEPNDSQWAALVMKFDSRG